MNQEPDERPLNIPQAGPSFDPPFPAPAQPPYGPAGPERASDQWEREWGNPVPASDSGRRPPHQQHQPIRPAPAAEDELQARLRALRQRRQQAELGQPLPPVEFQRRGLPTPPNQPPLKDVLKHWWEHGPFSGSLPGQEPPEGQPGAAPPNRRLGRPTGPLSPSGPLSPFQRGAQEPPSARGRTGGLPRRGGPTQPLDERAKELFNQGKETLATLNARAHTMVNQAIDRLNERARQHLEQVSSQQAPPQPSLAQPPLAPQPERAPEGIVPGLVVIGFAPDISREEGIQRIAALGGTPLRYKESLNLFQVAVPPGQERAMIQRFLQRPEVVSAGVERQRPKG